MPGVGITVLKSGSDGNCTVVHCGESALLIDCGVGLKALRAGLEQAGIQEQWIKGILITHEHADHVKGLDVVARHLGVPVYATRLCADYLRGHIKKAPAFTLIEKGSDFGVGGFGVRAFPLQHDAVETVGYMLTHESTKVGVATDFGAATATTDFHLRGSDTLMIESNYDLNLLAASTRPWRLKQRILGPHGHMSNPDCAEMLGRILSANTRNVILAHISGECNKPELARAGAEASLRALQRQEVFLTCGSRSKAIPTVWC